jgi:hypothetical protein
MLLWRLTSRYAFEARVVASNLGIDALRSQAAVIVT